MLQGTPRNSERIELPDLLSVNKNKATLQEVKPAVTSEITALKVFGAPL